MIFEIGIGIMYLHSMQIVHRDLKPANIMELNRQMKIIDFGFATDDLNPQTNLGSLPY